MKNIGLLSLGALLLAATSACATLEKVDCAKAQKVRAAAVVTIETIDRVCPAPALSASG